MQLNVRLINFLSTEVLDYLADEGVQLHGGYGFMEEYEIEQNLS